MNIIEQNLESTYKIIYSEEYNQELEEIYYYIAIHLKEEKIAENLVKKIRKEILRLQYFPKENIVLLKNRKDKLYRLVVKNYIIIYQVNIKVKTVYILHIFNSRRNYLKLI